MTDLTKNPTRTQEERQPLAAHCHACGHVWAILWLPCPSTEIPRGAKAFRCPHCFEKKRVFMARSEDAAKIARPLICEVPGHD